MNQGKLFRINITLMINGGGLKAVNSIVVSLHHRSLCFFLYECETNNNTKYGNQI